MLPETEKLFFPEFFDVVERTPPLLAVTDATRSPPESVTAASLSAEFQVVTAAPSCNPHLKGIQAQVGRVSVNPTQKKRCFLLHVQ